MSCSHIVISFSNLAKAGAPNVVRYGPVWVSRWKDNTPSTAEPEAKNDKLISSTEIVLGTFSLFLAKSLTP